MNGLLLVLALGIGVGAVSVWYSSQMKKNYLHDLERNLEIQQFRMTGGMGSAAVEGVWKGCRIGIEALPSGPSLPSAIHYKMEHRSSFTAEIQPGNLLFQELRDQAAPKVKEPETLRPWRARLTEEEQAILDERRGGASEAAQVSRERLRISSPKPELVNQYLAQGTREQDVTTLFKQGFAKIQVDYGEVVLVKSPYTSVDMTPKVVERCLKSLKGLRVE